MAALRLVSLALLVAAVTLLSHTGVTSARSAALQRGSLTQLLSKRNSWWSKKSTDASSSSSSDFANIVPEASLDAQDLVENSSNANTELFLCYMSWCVPSFTACAAQSSASSFSLCQQHHRHCALRCLHALQ